MRTITVLLAEDHHLVREALRALLTEQDGVEVVGQAQDGNEALELARSLQPDIACRTSTVLRPPSACGACHTPRV